MAVRLGSIFAGSIYMLIGSTSVEAAKGDLTLPVRRSAPLLEGRVLDLHFADFAQGIWTRGAGYCQLLTTIDRAEPGTAIAIYRGLFERPTEICHVYGAEKRTRGTQRAAMNCQLDRGGETLGLVTVWPLGKTGLGVQDGDHPPEHYQFCRAITPVLQPVGQ